MPNAGDKNYYVQVDAKGVATGGVFHNKGSAAAAAEKAYDKKRGGVQTIRMYKRGAKKQPGLGYRVYAYKVSSAMVPVKDLPWKKGGKDVVLKKTAKALPAEYIAQIPES